MKKVLEMATATTPEALRAEIAEKRAAGVNIAKRIETAREQLREAMLAFQEAMEKFAVDSKAPDPDRAKVAELESKLATLQRIAEDNKQTVTVLEGQATHAEMARLAPAERSRIEHLAATARPLLGAYLQAMRAAIAAEVEFYASIATLKADNFRAAKRDAQVAYADIYAAAREAAMKAGYCPDPYHLNHSNLIDSNTGTFVEAHMERASCGRAALETRKAS